MLALSREQHAVAVGLTQVAHVAHLSEREVVVAASLANPVANACTCVFRNSVVFLNLALLNLLGFGSQHMLWLSFLVFVALSFVASMTLSATLEIVVLALAAFPASIWEHKIVGLNFFFFFLLLDLVFGLSSFLESFKGFVGAKLFINFRTKVINGNVVDGLSCRNTEKTLRIFVLMGAALSLEMSRLRHHVSWMLKLRSPHLGLRRHVGLERIAASALAGSFLEFFKF